MIRKLFFLLLLSAFASAATVTIDSVSFNPSTFVEDQTVTLSVGTKETSAAGNASVTLSVSLSSGLQFADTGLTTASKTYTISSGQTSTQTFQVKAVGSGTQTITTTLSSTATIQNGNDIQSVCAKPKNCVLSLSASSDRSSVAAAGTFTISATVTSCICNYESTNTQVSLLASPSGRVLFSPSSKSLGTVTTSSAANWLVTAGSTAGAVAFTLTASADSPTVSDSKQVSVTVTSSGGGDQTGGGTPSGGSGGAPAASETVKETKSIASIAPETPAVVSLTKAELSVSELKIEVKDAVTNVSVSVEKLDSKPSSITTLPTAEGKVYKYLSFTSTVPSASISKVKIKFKVEASWVSKNNFSTSTVYLNRYSSGWSKLPTTFLKSDSTYAYFESESPGFSTFAITGEKPAAAVPTPTEQQKPLEETKPTPIAPTPSGLAPVVSLITQADIDNALKSLNSVLPQTDEAISLLAQARARIAEAQTAFNGNEQARAKQLLDEARLLIDDAAGLRSAAVASGKTSIFTILLILVVLVVGVYAYYSRPASRVDVSQLAKLRKEKETLVQMKKNAEKEYLSRKIDQSAYKSMLADYEGKLIEVNTRIDELSKRNN